jgi:hypothetical protein
VKLIPGVKKDDHNVYVCEKRDWKIAFVINKRAIDTFASNLSRIKISSLEYGRMQKLNQQ